MMSSVASLLQLFALLHCSSSSWWITTEIGWTTNIPADCPREDPQTHVCFSLQEQTGMCIKVRCCENFPEHYKYYAEITDPDLCSVCYKSSPCSVYQCYSRCCDGYEADTLGRCQNKTGRLECQNGGTLRWDEWGNFNCDCQSGFRGRSCEIPICNCDNKGECIVKDGSPYCNCTGVFFGEKCEQSRCNKTCENGGVCFRENVLEICKCPYPYVGERCEILYENPVKCEQPSKIGKLYMHKCTSNADCPPQGFCCFDRHSAVCRNVPQFYDEGSKVYLKYGKKPSSCKNCNCLNAPCSRCFSGACPDQSCLSENKTPYFLPKCCRACTPYSSSHSPIIYDCPRRVYLETKCDDDIVTLTDTNVGIKAVDGRGKKLQLTFQPSQVRHCYCYIKTEVEVMAIAIDDQGISTKCEFTVTVVDECLPRFITCPNDIYVFDDEPVRWVVPSFYDNVAVASKHYSGHSNHKFYPVGSHKNKYAIKDYKKNDAECIFTVHVTRRGTPISLIPRGLIVRSLEIKHNLLEKLLIPLFVCLPLLIFATMSVMWYRGQKATDQLTPECDDASTETGDKDNEEHPFDTQACHDANNTHMKHVARTLPNFDNIGVHTN